MLLRSFAHKEIYMTSFADLIATGLFPHIVIDTLFVAVTLGVMIKFLRRI